MELEGVTNVQPADDHYEYFFTVSRQPPKVSAPKGSASKGCAPVENQYTRSSDNTNILIPSQVMCGSCREVHSKTVSLNQKVYPNVFPSPKTFLITEQKKKNQDEHEISGSKGKANFVWRCSNCKVWNVPHKTLRYAEI